MRHSQDLWQLIDSMTRTERRYFRLFASRHQKQGSRNSPGNSPGNNPGNNQGSKHLQLFEAFTAIPAPGRDADALRHLTFRPTANQLASAKYDLTGLILDGLAAYAATKSADSQLRKLLGHIEVLFKRGLFAHCQKVISRAKRKAEECHKYAYIIEILAWERKLLLRGSTDSLREPLRQYHEQQQQILDKIATVINYEDLADRVQEANHSYVHLRDPGALDELQQLMDSPLAQADPANLPLQAALKLLHSRGNFQRFRGDVKDAMRSYSQAIELWELNKSLIAEDPDNYKRFVTNYLSCAISIRYFDDFADSLKKIKQLPSTTIEEETTMFGIVTYLEFGYYLNYGLLAEARGLAAEFEQSVPRYHDRLRPDRLINLYFNCSLIYFLSGRYDQALEHVQYILAERRTQLKRDIQECTRLLLLVIHYELQNYDVLESMFRSTQRYLKGRDQLQVVEKAIISAIRKLIASADVASQKAVLMGLHSKLLGDVLNKTAAPPLGLLELMFWVESRVLNKSIENIFTSKMRSSREQGVQDLFAEFPED